MPDRAYYAEYELRIIMLELRSLIVEYCELFDEQELRGWITKNGRHILIGDEGSGSSSGAGKSIDKAKKSDIIKAVTINDFSESDPKGKISQECKETIINTLKEQDVSYVYDEIRLVNIPRSDDGKIEPLRTNAISSPGFPKIILEVNEAAFNGRTKEQIDLMFKSQDYSVANSLEEAVIHEAAHAKVIQGKTFARYEAINEELSNGKFTKPISGRKDNKSLKDLAGEISKYAQKDGLECIAETHVIISRKVNISKELKVLHDEYIQ